MHVHPYRRNREFIMAIHHLKTARSESKVALARLATALAVVSTGAFAIGALAVGALAIRRLALGTAYVQRLRIKELEVDSLKVHHFMPVDEKSAAGILSGQT
jgi:hypothetical protein